MPNLGGLAAMLAREATGNINALSVAKAMNWQAGIRMLERRAVGDIEANFSTTSGTGTELTALVGSLSAQYFGPAVIARAQAWEPNARVGVMDGGIVAAETTEAFAVAPVTLQTGVVQIQPARVSAIIAVSQETLNTRNAAALLNAELERAIGRGVDKLIISRLKSHRTSSSTLPATSNALDDLLALTGAVLTVSGQSLVYGMSLDVQHRAAFLTSSGVEVFPMLGPVGSGSIKDVPAYGSDQMDAATMWAVDPTAYAASVFEVEVIASKEACLEMVENPSLPSALTSMFQTASTAIMCNARLTFQHLRTTDGASDLSGIAWANS